MMKENDELYMKMALEEAIKAELLGEVPIGAIIVVNAEIYKGHNRTIMDCDPSAHAEIVALREAGRGENNHRLLGATVYTTLEPCVMCIGALLQARVARLVYGCADKRFGACGSCFDLTNSPNLNHRISEMTTGILAEESLNLLQNFFKSRRNKK